MCSHKPDIYSLRCELNHNNQTKVIPLDIEHIMLVSNAIHTVECLLDVCKTCPFSLFGFVIPLFQGCFGLRVLGVVLNQCALSYDSHCSMKFAGAKIVKRVEWSVKKKHFFGCEGQIRCFCPERRQKWGIGSGKRKARCIVMMQRVIVLG
jgi:hypothetical protein